MQNIILLSSFHLETGKCNSIELFSIIEKIQPEVIFEELSCDIFDAIYFKGYDPQSLEAKAIKKYKEKYSIKNFPVDTYDLDLSQFFQGYDIISNKNSDYLELFNKQLKLVHKLGYSFINSNEFAEMLEKLQNIEKNTLLEINDSELLAQYNFGILQQDKRDVEMLQNIYNYSNNLQYKSALFICGAEHKKSIIQKIPDFETNEKIKLNWTFYN